MSHILSTATVATVVKGEYVRFKVDGPVWIRGEYDRTEKKYELCKADDMNHVTYKKGSFAVFVGFDY